MSHLWLINTQSHYDKSKLLFLFYYSSGRNIFKTFLLQPKMCYAVYFTQLANVLFCFFFAANTNHISFLPIESISDTPPNQVRFENT